MRHCIVVSPYDVNLGTTAAEFDAELVSLAMLQQQQTQA